MGANWQPLNKKLWFSIPLITAGAFINFANTVVAQVTPDQSLGKENSVVTPLNPNTERIDGGAVRGSNLFHSFKEFNVGEGKRIDFANPAGIENILSRVTGNNPSNIFGTLGVLGDANLFLLNPNGIIFGPNSRLDIRGSFVASTGNGINFADRTLYGGNDLESKPLLTMAVPVGLQYGTQQAGDINNQGNLQVGERQKLTLAGNNITSSGKLTAPGGTVQVLGKRVGLVDNARIDVSGDTGGGNVLIGGDFQGKGEVPNAKRTFVSSGASINADALTSGDGGRVIVWADETTGFYGDISARGGSQFGNGGFAEVSGKENLIFRGDVDLGAGNGSFGTLLLDPRDIVISNDVSDSSGVKDELKPEGSNEEANILKNDFDRTPITISQARLEKIGEKNAVKLEATNDITIGNLKDNILTFKKAPGQSITFKAGGFFKMNLDDTIRTNGRDIEISGASIELGDINTSINTANFNGGNITLEATGIISTGLIDTAGVSNEVAGSSGALNGANVNIKSSNGSISFTNPVPNNGSNIYGKSITINTPSTITAEGALNARNDVLNDISEINIGNIFAPSSITVAGISTRNLKKGCVCDVGNGGNINIKTTGLLKVTSAFSENSGILNDPINPNNISIGSQAIGNGGTIDIVADGGIETKAGIVSNSRESGKGGDITLNSKNGFIKIQAGTVDSSSTRGNGGIINLTAAKDITTGSILSNSKGSGNGGDITLISNDGTIDTSTGILNASSGTGDLSLQIRGLDTGNAGTVKLNAGKDIFSGSIESAGLKGGNITLNSGNTIYLDKADIASVSTGNSGKGENIEFNASEILFKDGRVATVTVGEADGGDIIIKNFDNNSNKIEIINTNNSSQFQAFVSPLLRILRKDPRFEGAGFAATASRLDNLPNLGNTGNITVKTGILSIKAKDDAPKNDRTGIASTTFLSRGNSNKVNTTNGDVNVTAYESLTIIGNQKEDTDFDPTPANNNETPDEAIKNAGELANEVQFIPTGITSATQGENNAGSITVNTGKLTIKNRAAITSGTTEDATGNGGAIIINADSVELDDKAALATGTLSPGNAGKLTVNVPEGDIRLSNRALIAADSTGSGNTGGLEINASNIYFGDNSRIGSGTLEGKGGDININVANNIDFEGKDSEISSEALGNASGGNLTIEAGRFIRSMDSITANNDIVVTADGTGKGGELKVTVIKDFGFLPFNKVRTPDSDFSAASRLGEDGLLSVTAESTEPQLPQQPNTPEIVQVCPASQGVTTRAAGRSEYINTGHGGLPPNPNQALESNTAQVPWVTLNPQENKPTANYKPKVIREAQGWVKMPNGKLLLTTRKSNSSSSSCVFQSN